MPRKHVFALFPLTFRSGNKFFSLLVAFYRALSALVIPDLPLLLQDRQMCCDCVFFFNAYHIYDPLFFIGLVNIAQNDHGRTLPGNQTTGQNQ